MTGHCCRFNAHEQEGRLSWGLGSVSPVGIKHHFAEGISEMAVEDNRALRTTKKELTIETILVNTGRLWSGLVSRGASSTTFPT